MRDTTQSSGETPARRENGLEDFTSGLIGGSTGPFQSQTIAQPWTFAEGMAYTPFTLNRIALSYGYMSYGLVQTVVDQPVEDAFRGGIKIESAELDPNDIKILMKEIEANNDLDMIKETAQWARLYGGSGLIINNEQHPTQPFRANSIKKGSSLCFIPADRWELILTGTSISGNQYGLAGWQENKDAPFNYYGVQLHSSRAMRMLGKSAPSFIRQRLQGWGMSELERCMREINTYIKFQNLLFELVDEAKIDIYKLEDFNTSLADATATAAVVARVQLSNLVKNFKKAIVMDQKDEYEQKQIAFSGLADINEQFRISLCSALKIPYNKLFGQSATGFSSGEDSMENYNAMIDSCVRDKVRKMVREVIELRMRAVFGYAPEFEWDFMPLRILDDVKQTEVDVQKQKMATDLFDRDLYSGQEVMESLHKDGLINIDSEVMAGKREPISPLEMQQDAQDQAAKAGPTKEKKNGRDRLAQMLQFERDHHARNRRAAA